MRVKLGRSGSARSRCISSAAPSTRVRYRKPSARWSAFVAPVGPVMVFAASASVPANSRQARAPISCSLPAIVLLRRLALHAEAAPIRLERPRHPLAVEAEHLERVVVRAVFVARMGPQVRLHARLRLRRERDLEVRVDPPHTRDRVRQDLAELHVDELARVRAPPPAGAPAALAPLRAAAEQTV